MDAFTFIVLKRLFVPEGNAAFRQVVGRHLHFHFVPGKDFDVVHAHLSRDVGRQHVAVVQFDAEHGVGQGLDDRAVAFDSSLFCP